MKICELDQDMINWPYNVNERKRNIWRNRLRHCNCLWVRTPYHRRLWRSGKWNDSKIWFRHSIFFLCIKKNFLTKKKSWDDIYIIISHDMELSYNITNSSKHHYLLLITYLLYITHSLLFYRLCIT